jgi:hypothetical protein
MTSRKEEFAALALLCDTNGVVRQVLYDGLDAGQISSGQPFESALDFESREKGRAFLEAVREKGAAFDWELNLAVGERSQVNPLQRERHCRRHIHRRFRHSLGRHQRSTSNSSTS